MRRRFVSIVVSFIIAVCAVPACGAQVDWKVYQTIELENAPRDMLVAPGSQRVYILNDQGEIAIYTFNGQLKGKIMVGPDALQIKAGPVDDILFVLREGRNAIESIRITLTEELDIQGSPFKGAADAPVTLVIFSDFQ
jgi:hypothetical protein